MVVCSIINVILCSYVLKGVVSETCLDVRHVNYTIKCKFEKCTIPGQFCDYSDENFPRCANCDQDKCNEAIIPGECTIPCMLRGKLFKQDDFLAIFEYRHVFDNLTKIINKCKEDDTFWKRDFVAKILSGVVVLLVIIILPMALKLWSQRRLLSQERSKEQEMKSPIAHPEEEDDHTNKKNIAPSNSTVDIPEEAYQQ